MYLFHYINARRMDCVYASLARADALAPTIRFSRVNMFSSIRTHGIYYSRAQTIPSDFFSSHRWRLHDDAHAIFTVIRTLYLRITF